MVFLALYLAHRQAHKTACITQSCLKVEGLIKLSSLYWPAEVTFSSYRSAHSSPLVTSSTGLLEDERLASAHQAEAFTRQIQNLQGNKHNTT